MSARRRASIVGDSSPAIVRRRRHRSRSRPAANLQAAIDSAQPGDTILLAAGRHYRGNFILPAKSGSSYITIRSAAPTRRCRRTASGSDRSYAPQLPKVQGRLRRAARRSRPRRARTTTGCSSSKLSSTYAAQQHHRARRLDRRPRPRSPRCRTTSSSTAATSTATPTNGQKRGIALNSAATTIVNSYISDIKSSQAGHAGDRRLERPGAVTIENNYLEAAGENVLFGGADPYIPNLVPSDITIRSNHITSRVAWRGQAGRSRT